MFAIRILGTKFLDRIYDRSPPEASVFIPNITTGTFKLPKYLINYSKRPHSFPIFTKINRATIGFFTFDVKKP